MVFVLTSKFIGDSGLGDDRGAVVDRGCQPRDDVGGGGVCVCVCVFVCVFYRYGDTGRIEGVWGSGGVRIWLAS